MMNFINSIPENVGYFMVGATAMLCAVMAVVLVKVVIETIADRTSEEEEV